MDRKDLEAELSLLIDEMEGDQGDRHEIYLRIRQMIKSMEATGMPAPDDLVRMERELEKEFAADKESGA
jgi:hypothetical protein